MCSGLCTGIAGVYIIIGLGVAGAVCFIAGVLYDARRYRDWRDSDFSK